VLWHFAQAVEDQVYVSGCSAAAVRHNVIRTTVRDMFMKFAFMRALSGPGKIVHDKSARAQWASDALLWNQRSAAIFA
jgi:hypothetical protein